MTALEIVYSLFSLCGGLAVFMYGMKIMGDNLERVAGGKMRGLLGKVSNNRFAGVGIGTAVTALIQSSSATTVMLVGFVNVGIITLVQATSIIMGANIGTTITAQIASLSVFANVFDVTAIFSVIALVGVFMNMFSGKDGVKRVGVILAGLGMLFIGLMLMSSAMEQFKSVDWFLRAIRAIENPFLMILIGMVFTAIIQSSSAATGILIPMVSQGIMGVIPSLFFVLGTNIGTCITALFASIGATTNGKRTAFIHFFFNVVGVAVFTVLLLLLKTPIERFLDVISGGEPARMLANFHTIFNVLVTLLLLPFVKQIVRVAEFVVREKKGGKDAFAPVREFQYIDERILETPPMAVAQTLKEVMRMNELAKENLQRSVECLFEYDEQKAAMIDQVETTLDSLNRSLTAFLVRLTSLNISARDEKLIGTLYHVISDIERIGDYATNVQEYAKQMKEENITFSKDAQDDVHTMYEKVMLLYRDVMYVFEKRDPKMLSEVARREQEIDLMKLTMSNSHVKRLNQGLCSAESGAVYLSLASNLERVADHLTNIGYSIRSYTGSSHDNEKI